MRIMKLYSCEVLQRTPRLHCVHLHCSRKTLRPRKTLVKRKPCFLLFVKVGSLRVGGVMAASGKQRSISSVLSSGLQFLLAYLTLWNPMDCSLPGSSVHGFLQARILEWVAMLSSKGSSQHRDQTQVSRIAGSLFTIWATREASWSSVYNA